MKSDKIRGRPIRLNLCKLIPQRKDFAEVMFIGDLHWGSPQCDIKRFLGNIKYCLENKIYVYLMGDLSETATRHSVGAGVYEQEHIADKQHEDLVGWLQPLADNKLILGTHSGNHGARVYKETGFDMEKALARELKIPYLGDACWSRFKVGGETYTLYTLHGRTGSRFDGTALLALERISASFFADAVICGHSHKSINSIVLMQRIVDRRVVEHKKHLIIAGHYVSYDKGYGQALGLPLSKLGSPKVKFFTDKHDILVSW